MKNSVTARIEEIGLTKILQILDDLGDWPVLKGSAWDESSYDWKDDIYNFRRYGYSTDFIISFSIVPDMKNTTVRRLQVSISTNNKLNQIHAIILLSIFYICNMNITTKYVQ